MVPTEALVVAFTTTAPHSSDRVGGYKYVNNQRCNRLIVADTPVVGRTGVPVNAMTVPAPTATLVVTAVPVMVPTEAL